MADQIDVKVAAQIAEFQAAMREVKETVEGVSGTIKGFGEMFTGIGEALAAAFAVEKVAHWAEEVAEAGERVMHMSQMLGMSVSAVGNMGASLRILGMDSDSAGMAFMRLERNMAQAAAGAQQQKEAFQAVGISAAELKTMSPEEVLGRMADRFAETDDGANKTAVAIALLGRAGAQMIPFLDRGREGLAEFARIGQETGSVLTKDMAEGMEQTAMGAHIAGMAFTGVSYTLFEAMKPGIDYVIDGITELVEWFNNAIKDGGALSGAMDVLVFAFESLLTVVVGLVTGFAVVGTGFKAIIDEVMILSGTIAQVFDRLAHRDWSGAANAAKGGATMMKDVFTGAISDIEKQLNEFGAKTSNMFSGKGRTFVGGEHKGGDQMDSPTAAKSRIPDWKTELDEMKDAFAEENGALFEFMKSKEVEFWSAKLALTVEGTKEYKAVLHEVVQARKAQGTEEMASATATFKAMIDAAKNNEEEQKKIMAAQLAEALATYGADSAKYKAVLLEKQKLDEQWFKKHREMMIQAAEFEEKGQLDGVKMTEEHIKTLQGLGLISMGQYISMERELADDKLAIELDYLQKKLALQISMGDDPAKIQQTNQAMEQAHRDHASRMLSIDDEAAKNTTSVWKVAVQTIQGAFDTMLDGILRGTQTWQQAMSKLFLDLEITFIKNVANMMLEWAAFQAGLTNVNPFGPGGISMAGIFAAGVGAKPNSQILTGAGMGAAAGGAEQLSGPLESAIVADTAATAESTKGVMGWIQQQLTSVAQTLGLTTATTASTTATAANSAATATATTAHATVSEMLIESMMVLTASLDANTAAIEEMTIAELTPLASGSWSVPRDMPAFIHKDEMILPSELASKVRGGAALATKGLPSAGGGAGGGPVINVHMHGDVYGMDDFNSRVADAVQSGSRNFNPAYDLAARRS